MHTKFTLLCACFLLFVVVAATHVGAVRVGKQQLRQLPTIKGVAAGNGPKVVWQNGDLEGVCLGAPYYDKKRDIVFINVGDGNEGGGIEGGIYALNASNGTSLYSVTTQSTDAYSDIIPAGDDKICACTGSNVGCYNPDTLAKVWNYNAGGAFETTPLYVASKRRFFAANNQDSKLYAFSENGTLVFTTKLAGGNPGGIQPTYSSKHDLVYVGAWQSMNAVDASSGTLRWNTSYEGWIETTATLSDDQSTIFFGDDYHGMQAASASNGSAIWNYTKYGRFENKPSIRNGVVYFGDSVPTAVSSNCYAVHQATGKHIWKLANCAAGGIVGYSQFYGDQVLFPTAKGIVSVSLDGSGIVWNWMGMDWDWVQNFQAPTSDGVLFVVGSNAEVFRLQLPPKHD